MIDELKLLRGEDFKIEDKLTIHHPKLSEITDAGEKEYYSAVFTLCSTPSDYKSVLYDDFGVDYETVEDFEFFLMMWGSISNTRIDIFLPDIHPENYRMVRNNNTDETGLYDPELDIFIGKDLYTSVTDYIRKMHGITKHFDKAGNESTKKYLIKKARKELQKRDEGYKSTLAPLVSSMVNCSDFKYDHSSVWDLNIYQFMDSVKRIQKLKSVEHITQGVYAGTIDQKKISKDALNWLGEL